MGEIVRYAMGGHGETMRWPQRCPCCGAGENLVYTQFRAAREKDSYTGIRVRFSTEWFDLPVLTCSRHAHSNWLGGKILERTAAASIFRYTVAFCLFLMAVVLFQWASGMRTWHDMMASSNFKAFFLMCGGYAGAGFLLIVWAKMAAKAYVLKLDNDANVAILRFSSEKYAREFKRLNIKATSRRLTDSMPFFLRPSVLKFVFGVAAVLFVFMLILRN